MSSNVISRIKSIWKCIEIIVITATLMSSEFWQVCMWDVNNVASFLWCLCCCFFTVPPTIYSVKNVTQTENLTTTLICESFGDPPPDMTYRKEGSKVDLVMGLNVRMHSIAFFQILKIIIIFATSSKCDLKKPVDRGGPRVSDSRGQKYWWCPPQLPRKSWKGKKVVTFFTWLS